MNLAKRGAVVYTRFVPPSVLAAAPGAPRALLQSAQFSVTTLLAVVKDTRKPLLGALLDVPVDDLSGVGYQLGVSSASAAFSSVDSFVGNGKAGFFPRVNGVQLGVQLTQAGLFSTSRVQRVISGMQLVSQITSLLGVLGVFGALLYGVRRRAALCCVRRFSAKRLGASARPLRALPIGGSPAAPAFDFAVGNPMLAGSNSLGEAVLASPLPRAPGASRAPILCEQPLLAASAEAPPEAEERAAGRAHFRELHAAAHELRAAEEAAERGLAAQRVRAAEQAAVREAMAQRVRAAEQAANAHWAAALRWAEAERVVAQRREEAAAAAAAAAVAATDAEAANNWRGAAPLVAATRVGAAPAAAAAAAQPAVEKEARAAAAPPAAAANFAARAATAPQPVAEEEAAPYPAAADEVTWAATSQPADADGAAWATAPQLAADEEAGRAAASQPDAEEVAWAAAPQSAAAEEAAGAAAPPPATAEVATVPADSLAARRRLSDASEGRPPAAPTHSAVGHFLARTADVEDGGGADELPRSSEGGDDAAARFLSPQSPPQHFSAVHLPRFVSMHFPKAGQGTLTKTAAPPLPP
jgi:hypothetical protein